VNIISYIKIIRPVNFLFVILAVLFGAFYKSDTFNLYIPILAAISAAFISGAGFALNDFFDVEIDKINRPHRPIPSGKISTLAAKRYAILLIIIGNLICFSLFRPVMLILAIFNSIILWVYAWKSKKLIFVSNLIVAFTTASTFIYGGLSNNNLRNGMFVFFCAFIYTLIRELVKDIEDIAGDKAEQSITLPIVLGVPKTIIVALFLGLIFSLIIFTGWNEFYNFTIS